MIKPIKPKCHAEPVSAPHHTGSHCANQVSRKLAADLSNSVQTLLLADGMTFLLYAREGIYNKIVNYQSKNAGQRYQEAS
jgi:hypothetical protein